ncbi:YihY/virulence factor BrkB family protein [Halomarina litorea]|uniref:YihY/virulence factor BrkB family protein n=1 Tax=Halomarina litorea TaxID=2961595 RepID=UPI0020C1F1FB|nr:YihY/virulence factor BrkB family protein [Halomarina sp. BCD28]
MSNDRVSLRSVPRAVVNEIREENVPFMAGSIAYQAFVSLIPLLILAFVVVTVVGDQQLAQRVVAATEGSLPDSAQTLLSDIIVGSESAAGVSVIGVVTLTWGALKIFRGLDTAFSEIFDTDEQNSLPDQIKDGLVVLVVLIVAVIAAVVAGTAVAALNVPFLGVVSTLLLLVVLTGAFVPMYYLFPDLDLPMRHVLPGAAFAAVGWTALQALFSVYVAVSGKADAYGVLGAVLLLVTWLYFSGLVLLVGATLNSVLAGRTGQSVEEDEDAESTDTLPDLEEGESPALAADRTAARIEESVSRRERRELARENADLRSERDRLRRQNHRLRRELGYRRQPTWARLYRRLRGD